MQLKCENYSNKLCTKNISNINNPQTFLTGLNCIISMYSENNHYNCFNV